MVSTGLGRAVRAGALCFDRGQSLSGLWLGAPYAALTLGWVVAVHQVKERYPDQPARWFLVPQE